MDIAPDTFVDVAPTDYEELVDQQLVCSLGLLNRTLADEALAEAHAGCFDCDWVKANASQSTAKFWLILAHGQEVIGMGR